MQTRNWNLGLALCFIAASLLTLFVWIPNDIESGVLIEERRSIDVGDALAPTAAAIAVLITSIALLLSSLLANRNAVSSEPPVGVSRSNLISIVTMALLLIVSLQLMVWGGPLTVKVLQSVGVALPEYRLLTDTIPYKYVGFVVGGFTLVCGLITWIEGRTGWRVVFTAIAAVVVLIIVYDVPFDSLLLPPNGSQ
ncbi:MAG: hypothetical protein ACI89J_000363 [Hyphomicrobiaceae bacterium]|jgi:hypothetical protein